MTTRLYNSSRLAKRLGFSLWKLAMMKRSGFVMSHGMQSTEDAAIAWLAENPDFRTSAGAALPPLQPQKRRKRATAGKSGELAHSNG